MIHQLKTESQFFEASAAGEKNFEVRENDRDFRVGDLLALNEVEWNEKTEVLEYTGRCSLVIVTYILDDPRYLRPGYVVLSTLPCEIKKKENNLRTPVYR